MKALVNAQADGGVPGTGAIRRVLAEAANAAARTTNDEQPYLAARYRRLVVRIGKPKATVTVGHTMLRIVYHILVTKEPYRELTLTSLNERRRA